jgi:prepilin-type N-terminal cleavage/methylation domain-containing protein
MVVAMRQESILMSQNQATEGFTLVEVMMVSAIVALTATVAVPAYLQCNSKNQLKQGMTELHRSLNLARVAAMARNTTVTVTLDNNVVDPTDGVPKVTATFSPAVIPPVRMAASVTAVANVTSPGTVPFNIRFSSLGVQLGGNQSFTVTNNQGLVYSGIVAPTGKATWCPKSTCP